MAYTARYSDMGKQWVHGSGLTDERRSVTGLVEKGVVLNGALPPCGDKRHPGASPLVLPVQRLVLVALLVVAQPAAASIQIVEAMPRARTGWATEHIVLEAEGPTDLEGWRLTDGEGAVELAGKLDAGDRLVVAEDRDQITRWRPLPDLVVPYGSTAFKLADGGDRISAVDPRGSVHDSLHYGSVGPGPGWRGAPVARPDRGQILVRQGTDTDTATDFASRRVRLLGQTDVETRWHRGDVTLFAAPESSHEVTMRFLAGVERDLDLDLYQVTHPEVRATVRDRVAAGADVEVLVEGGPVGWNFTMPEPRRNLEPARWRVWHAANQQTWVLSGLRRAGAEVSMLGNARYRFDHAKYAIADDRVLVGTENWGDTGLPKDPTFGNRGFGVVVAAPAVAERLSEVFAADADRSRPDVRPHDLTPDPAFVPDRDAPTGGYDPRHEPVSVEGVRVRLVLGPDDPWTVLDRIAEAEERVRVWALDLNVDGPAGAPFREALVSAAANGADVAVLVNDNPTYDPEQVQRVADILEPHGIEVAGLRAGEPFVNLHAKAAVVDDVAYVGSANFNRNAFTTNREVGVLVESRAASDWMMLVFETDRELARQVAGVDDGPPLLWGVVAVVACGGLAIGSRRLR